LTPDFSIQLYSGGLDVLCSIIIGYDIHPDDGGSNLPYRRLSDIKNFFTDIGIAVIDESSREKTARATLSSINSNPKLKTCIESALLPAHFLGMGNPHEAFDELLPHLEAVGWTLKFTKQKVTVLLDEETDEQRTENPSISKNKKLYPSDISDLLQTVIKRLPRSMIPLSQRRAGSVPLKFTDEYDVQDLLHSLLTPWVADIRGEEYTPSYAGTSTRMDFLLPKYSTVIETKIVRDKAHSKKIGDELILDIAHYRVHPDCKELWCVIYDPHLLIKNEGGLKVDLEGRSSDAKGEINVIVRVI